MTGFSTVWAPPMGELSRPLAVTERALLSPLRGHLSHRERLFLYKYQFAEPENDCHTP